MKAPVSFAVLLLAFLLIVWLELFEAKNHELRRSLSTSDGRLPFDPYGIYKKDDYNTKNIELLDIDKISDTTTCMVPQDNDPIILLFYIPDGGTTDYMQNFLKTQIFSGALAQSLQADFKEIASLRFAFIVYRNGASRGCKEVGQDQVGPTKECHCPFMSPVSANPPRDFHVESWINTSKSRDGYNFLFHTIHNCAYNTNLTGQRNFTSYAIRQRSQKIAIVLGDRPPGYINNLDHKSIYEEVNIGSKDHVNDYSITRFFYFVNFYRLGTSFLVTKNVLNDYIVLNNKLRKTVYSTVYEIEKYEPGVMIRDSLMGYIVRRMSYSNSRVGVYDSMDLIATLPATPEKVFEKYKIAVTYVLNPDGEKYLSATDWDLSSCHNFMLNLARILQRKFAAKLLVSTGNGFLWFETGSNEHYRKICLSLQSHLLTSDQRKIFAYEKGLSMWGKISEYKQSIKRELFHIIIMHRFNWYYGNHEVPLNLREDISKNDKKLTHIIWLGDKPFDHSKAHQRPGLKYNGGIDDSPKLDYDITPIETKIGAGNTLVKILKTIDNQLQTLGTVTETNKYHKYCNEKFDKIDSVHFSFPHNPGTNLHGMMLSLLHNKGYLAKQAILNHFKSVPNISFSTYPSVEWMKTNKADSKTCNFINSFGSLSESLNNVIPNGKAADAIWMGTSNCAPHIKGVKKLIFLFSETLPSGYGITNLEHDTFTNIGDKLEKEATRVVAIVPHHLLHHWRKHIYSKIWLTRFIYVHPFYPDDSIGILVEAANKAWENKENKYICGKSYRTG